MKLNLLLAIAVALVGTLAGQMRAATTISVNYPGEATTGLPGYRTLTLTASSDAGKIIGFNFDNSGDSGLGFFGDFNQVNPFGAPTVWRYEHGAIDPSPTLPADTYFLVNPADGIAVNAAESSTYIGAAWNLMNTANATSSLAFIRLVVREGDSFSYAGDFTVETPSGNVLERVSAIVPEPAAIPLLATGVLASVVAARRRRN